jgi:hypothetical protein
LYIGHDVILFLVTCFAQSRRSVEILKSFLCSTVSGFARKRPYSTSPVWPKGDICILKHLQDTSFLKGRLFCHFGHRFAGDPSVQSWSIEQASDPSSPFPQFRVDGAEIVNWCFIACVYLNFSSLTALEFRGYKHLIFLHLCSWSWIISVI